MSGGGESLGAYVHPELVDCAKAVSICTPFTLVYIHHSFASAVAFTANGCK